MMVSKSICKIFFALLFVAALHGQQLVFPQQPTGLTAVFVGTPAATGYYYWVAARYPYGISGMAGPAAILTGSATLSPSTNAINVTWTAASGATGYDLLETTTSSPPTGNCNCALLINSTALSYNDTGVPHATYTVPVKGLIFPDASAQSTSAPGVTGGPTTATLSVINGTGNTLPVLKPTDVASAVNWIVPLASATGTPVQLQAAGSDTNIDFTLAPKGTGAVILTNGVYSAELSITIANLNTPTSNILVPATTGRTYKVVGFFLQAIGGAVTGCTDVRLSDTAGGPVDIVTEAVAGLTQNQGVTEESLVANLTFGAGWAVPLTANQGIQIRKTGGACATATSVFARVLYKINF